MKEVGGGEEWEREFEEKFIAFYFDKETFEPRRPVLLPEDVKEWARNLLSKERASARQEGRDEAVEYIEAHAVLRVSNIGEITGYEMALSLLTSARKEGDA